MLSKLRILCLGDPAVEPNRIRAKLVDAGYKVRMTIAGTKKKYVKALNRFNPDVIVSGNRMQNFKWNDALSIYRDHTREVPFILVGDKLPTGKEAAFLRAGKYDFVHTEELNRLPDTIQTAISRKSRSSGKEIKLKTESFEEQHILSLLEKLPVCVYSIRTFNGKKSVYVSPNIKALTGFDPEYFTNDPHFWSSRFHPDDRARIFREINQLYSTGAQEFEYRWKTADDTYRWFFEKMVFYKAGCDTQYLAGAFVDITDCKKSSELIKNSELKYRNLVEKMREGLVYLDRNNNIEFVNEQFCRLFATSGKELIGKNIFLLMKDPQQKSYIRKRVKKRMAGISEQYDMQVAKFNGEKIWIHVNASPILSDNGKFIGTLSTIVDITERKTAEDKLEAKIRELNTFLYRTTHDLRSPLTSLLGLVNIAKMEVENEKAHEYLEMIFHSASRLDDILTDLFKIISITQSEPEQKEIDFSGMTKEIFSNLSHLPESSGVMFYPGHNPAVPFYSDPSLIQSILQNLIDNAIKYRKENYQHSFVKVEFSAPGNCICIDVSDNGRGIHESIQPKVFDLFFRGDEKSKGTGLGLYITKSAVERLGGKIEMESREGEGSKFSVFLPRVKGQPV